MVQEITFAQWLKSRRRMLDLTQQALADRVNCSVETIYKIEAGQRRPSAQIARLIATELNIPTGELDAFVKFARSRKSTKVHTHRVEIAPWRDAFIPNNNLPLQLTTLLGRKHQLEDARSRLRQDVVRLLSVLGPPGIGKTRLAIQLGNDILLDFPDGVFFVELASITRSDRVVLAIAQTLDISLAGHKKPLDSLKNYLYERRLLLILDNFEQVLSAAPDIHSILTACPLVKVLVTSRAPLKIRGERQFHVEPLALPSHINEVNVQRLANFSAVQLFLERARVVQPAFELTPENVAVVGSICARLDGLPLAIEIVAAQINILQPEEILRHLTGRDLLDSQGMADSDHRHQTLYAAIQWSYQLLNAQDQAFFRRMGVFVSGCVLESARDVCQPEQGAIHALTRLVNMNLLRREAGTDDRSRYTMLETIREFARNKLETDQEWHSAQGRHAKYFHEFALAHESMVLSNQQATGLERFEQEHYNLQAALDYFIETESWVHALELAGALIHFWVYRNHLITGLHYLTKLLTLTGQQPALKTHRVRLLNGAAMLSHFAGERSKIGTYALAALDVAQATNDYREIMWACITLGMRSGGMGNFDDAEQYFEQGLDASKQIDAPWELVGLLNGLGEIARSQNQYDRAMSYYQEALPIVTESGDQWLLAHLLDNMGHTAYSQAQYDVAYTYVCQSMEASIMLDDERGIAMCLEKLGGISMAKGQFEFAAKLLGAADALRQARNAPIEPMDIEDYEQFMITLRENLPSPTLQVSWETGQKLPLTRIIDQALTM